MVGICFVCKASTQNNSICNKNSCRIAVELMDRGNIISNQILKDFMCSKLVIDLAVCAVTTERWKLVFLPCPVYFKDRSQIDIIKAATAVQNKWNQIISTILDNQYNRDKELHVLLGDDQYVFLKFTMMTQLDQIAYEPELSIEAAESAEHNIPELQVYSIPAAENSYLNFSEIKINHGMVFHGSRCENWYSIIRNGIKNMSGTAWMVNGKVNGNGIYCGTSADISSGYTSNPIRIVAVLMATQSLKSWKKSPDAYVLPHSKLFEITHLMVCSGDDFKKSFQRCEQKLKNHI